MAHIFGETSSITRVLQHGLLYYPGRRTRYPHCVPWIRTLPLPFPVPSFFSSSYSTPLRATYVYESKTSREFWAAFLREVADENTRILVSNFQRAIHADIVSDHSIKCTTESNIILYGINSCLLMIKIRGKLVIAHIFPLSFFRRFGTIVDGASPSHN